MSIRFQRLEIINNVTSILPEFVWTVATLWYNVWRQWLDVQGACPLSSLHYWLLSFTSFPVSSCNSDVSSPHPLYACCLDLLRVLLLACAVCLCSFMWFLSLLGSPSLIKEDCVVRLRGLPFQASLKDVAGFLSGLNFIP